MAEQAGSRDPPTQLSFELHYFNGKYRNSFCYHICLINEVLFNIDINK